MHFRRGLDPSVCGSLRNADHSWHVWNPGHSNSFCSFINPCISWWFLICLHGFGGVREMSLELSTDISWFIRESLGFATNYSEIPRTTRELNPLDLNLLNLNTNICFTNDVMRFLRFHLFPTWWLPQFTLQWIVGTANTIILFIPQLWRPNAWNEISSKSTICTISGSRPCLAPGPAC